MQIRQRQIVEVQFPVPPNGKLLNHPCVVLSNDDINEEEQYFVGVMMTSEERYKGDLYTLEITPKMLNKSGDKKFSAVRFHLINWFRYKDVTKSDGTELTHEAFARLKAQINEITFGSES